MEIKATSSGDWAKSLEYLQKCKKLPVDSILVEGAQEGVNALQSATPVRTGKTAASWSYELSGGKGQRKITWTNSNLNKGVNVAMLIQTGHGTGTGGYVPPNDYINPAMKPVFESISKKIEKEVE